MGGNVPTLSTMFARAAVAAGGLTCLGGPIAAAVSERPGKTVEFSLTEGTWMSVDVSPDGKTIVFDLLNDIYAIPAEGGEATPLHSGSAIQRSPQFSSDGRSLLYLSDESGTDNVWVSNPDGSGATQITRENLAMLTGPAWAPDGQSVIATKTNASVFDMKRSEIRRFALAGSEETIVPPPESRKDVQEARLSPDGRYVYYTERTGGEHYVYLNTGHSNFVIKRRNLRTGETTDLIKGFGSATTPQVSPDGKSIAFIRRLGSKTVLFRHDLETGNQHPIYQHLDRDLQADYIPQEHYFPAFDWFPDNRHIAIWGKGNLLKIDTRSGQAEPIPFKVTARHKIAPALRTRLDAAPARVDVKVFRNIALNPAGDELLFRALGTLWQQDLAGQRAPRRFTSGGKGLWEPAWTPDGRDVAYVEWDDVVGSTLKLKSATGQRQSVLTTSGGIIRNPTFSPDGSRLAFTVMDPDSAMGGARDRAGLYILDVARKERRYVAPAAGLARFSPDGQRVFYFGAPNFEGKKAVVLRSISIDGSDAKDHAFAETADTGDFTISPDFSWMAFKHKNQLYLAPFDAGRAPAAVDAGGTVKARKLTKAGGFELSWAPDSSRLYWMLGRDIYVADPQASGLVPSPHRAITLTAKPDVPAGTIAFTNARIIPMTDQQVIERGTVVVEANRIKAIGPSDSVSVPRGAKVYDLDGKTLMPGFFDAHGHIDCCYGTGVLPIKQPTRYAAMAYGVTTNFDPYSSELTSYESGEMTLAGEIVGPRWLSSGHVIYGRSGKPDRVFDPITSLEDARNIVRRKEAIGGNILKSYKLPTRLQKQHLLQAAAEGGMMVDAEGAGHFYDNVSMILDGHTNLEHNLPVATYYSDLLQLFTHSDMSHTPTLIVTFGELFGENYIYQHQQPWKEEKVRAFIPDVNNAYNPISGPSGAPLWVRGMQTINYADELYDIGFRSVGRSIKRLDDAGVTINVGSHGQASGIAFHWEMQLLAEGGMKPMRILRAATINGAKTYGLDHQIGSLEPGKLADLIVLDKDPLADIRNTNSVRYTMVNGRLYDANTMHEIGNYDRPRGKFLWEVVENNGIDWNAAWSGY